MSKINVSRTDKMKTKTNEQLKVFIDAKTLSSAAAEYELNRRLKK